MKNIITATAIVISTVTAFSNPWELTVDASLTGGLNTYNDAWVGEEVGNIFWKSTLFSEADRQFTEIFRIENNLNLEFGQTFDQVISLSRWWLVIAQCLHRDSTLMYCG